MRCFVRCPGIAASLLVSAACSKSGRVTLASGGLTWEVIDGAWVVDGDTLIGSGGRVETTAEYEDATVELDVEQDADSRDRNVGICFRCSATDYDPNKTNGYEVSWTSQKRINEFVTSANVSKSLHRTWLPSPALQPLKNHVVVRTRGNTFIVEANGATVDSFTDGTYAHGHVRLWVESTAQTVRFAHVHITPG